MPMETTNATKIEKDPDHSSQVITPTSFFINIKCINSDGTINGTDSIQIEVKRTDLIALVKQKVSATRLHRVAVQRKGVE